MCILYHTLLIVWYTAKLHVLCAYDMNYYTIHTVHTYSSTSTGVMDYNCSIASCIVTNLQYKYIVMAFL